MPPRGQHRYGLWLTGIMVVVALLGSGALYYLLRRPEEVSLEQVFGHPAMPERDLPPRISLRPADVSTVRRGEIQMPTVATPKPAPPVAPTKPPASPLERARRFAQRQDWAPALALYDGLIQRNPDDRGLALERARVLAWSGKPGQAADAMQPIVAVEPKNAPLILERGRYLWWAGRGWAADSAVSQALSLDSVVVGGRELRLGIRQSLDPSAAVAREWLEQDSSRAMQLVAARAYARDQDYADALPLYRSVLGGDAQSDSLPLEMASVAMSADSFATAASVLETYVRAHPEDRDAQLRLAQAYSWGGETSQAIRVYGDLLAEHDDPTLRYQRAELYASTQDWGRARPDLQDVLTAEPDNGPALKLMGDIARWSGDWSGAVGYYHRAETADSTLVGVREGLVDAERMQKLVLASNDASVTPRRRVSVSASAELFGDSEEFRWYELRETWMRAFGRSGVGVALYQGFSRGLEAASLSSGSSAWGAGLLGRVALGDVVASGEAGFRTFAAGTTMPAFSVTLGLARTWPWHLELGYDYGPAVRRVATAAAMEADVRSSRIHAVAEHYSSGWMIGGDLELERLLSALGTTDRVAGNLTLAEDLGSGFQGEASVSLITTSGANPVLPGWGALYWTPVYYVGPQLGLRYETRLGPGWSADLRLAPGYAWVKERPGGEQRYGSQHVPFLGTGFDLTHSLSAWDVGLSADWTGALNGGYRAAALRIWFTPHLTWP